MRKPLFVAVLAALAIGLAVAGATRDGGNEPPAGAAVTSVFKVEGMTCGGCEVGVRMQVGKLDGVRRVEASFEESRAEVTYDPGEVTPEEIVSAIEKLGYEAELEKTEEGGSGRAR